MAKKIHINKFAGPWNKFLSGVYGIDQAAKEMGVTRYLFTTWGNKVFENGGVDRRLPFLIWDDEEEENK